MDIILRVSLQVIPFPPVSIIPPKFHISSSSCCYYQKDKRTKPTTIKQAYGNALNGNRKHWNKKTLSFSTTPRRFNCPAELVIRGWRLQPEQWLPKCSSRFRRKRAKCLVSSPYKRGVMTGVVVSTRFESNSVQKKLHGWTDAICCVKKNRIYMRSIGSWVGSVSIATSLWAGRPRDPGSVRGRSKRFFSLLQGIQTGCGTHEAPIQWVSGIN
jgi:hypothetical protein